MCVVYIIRKYNPNIPHTLRLTVVQLCEYMHTAASQRKGSLSSLQGYHIHAGIMFYSSVFASEFNEYNYFACNNIYNKTCFNTC